MVAISNVEAKQIPTQQQFCVVAVHVRIENKMEMSPALCASFSYFSFDAGFVDALCEFMIGLLGCFYLPVGGSLLAPESLLCTGCTVMLLYTW